MCEILLLSWPLSCKYAEILWKAFKYVCTGLQRWRSARIGLLCARRKFGFYFISGGRSCGVDQWHPRINLHLQPWRPNCYFSTSRGKLKQMEWELASKSVLLEYLPSGRAQPGPAPGRLALMLFANLFGLCRLFRFIVYKLQTDCFKKLASIRSARHQVLPMKV